MTDDARVIELEQRLAFQDDLLQKLDDALASQQRQILDLEHQLKVLIDHVKRLEQGGGQATAEDEKPPHY